VNTGWSGGAYGVGKRIRLRYTRAIIDAIHDGSLSQAPTLTDPVFGLEIPISCPLVPDEILIPKKTWADPDAFDQAAMRLAGLFAENFEHYQSGASEAVRAAGPSVAVGVSV